MFNFDRDSTTWVFFYRPSDTENPVRIGVIGVILFMDFSGPFVEVTVCVWRLQELALRMAVGQGDERQAEEREGIQYHVIYFLFFLLSYLSGLVCNALSSCLVH